MSTLKLIRLAICLATLVPLAARAEADRAMLLASDVQATEAGRAILRQGGSAADAAIAAALVLAVVSPQSAGPGGEGAALSYNAHSRSVSAWDGSSVAPAAAGPDLFLNRDGKPMALRDVVPGGRAVGVPSALRLLESLHRSEGRLTWDRLFTPAITLAENGYVVSPDLAAFLASGQKSLSDPVLALFRDDTGALPKAGERRRNHALAETLRMIATSGADAVLRGPISADIATSVRNDANPGLLTADDLAAFTLPTRPPLCTLYRSMKLCGLGPPDAGGAMLLQSLSLLDHASLPRLDPAGTESARALLQAWRRSQIGTAPLLADPEVMTLKTDDLLTPARTASLAALRRAAPGDASLPPMLSAPSLAATVLAVDRDGNAASLAVSLKSPFGAQIVTHGFLLNDALAGFAPVAGPDIPNHVDGSRHPLQNLALVLGQDTKGDLRLAGSGASDDSPAELAQLLVRLVDFHLAPRIAMSAPFWHLQPRSLAVDDVLGAKVLADALRARGEVVTLKPPSARLMLLSVGDVTTQARATQAYGQLSPAP